MSHFSIWPGSLLYMATVLPAIWVAELAILDEKIASGVDNCEQNAAESDFTVGRGLVRNICSSKSTTFYTYYPHSAGLKDKNRDTPWS